MQMREKNMLEILLEERARHPGAEARDYCKLLYQSEFGGGHMACEPSEALERLRGEIAACGAGADAPFARVGGGLLRLNLRALPALRLRPETVCGLFSCACAPRGSVAGLEEKLEILRANAARLGLDEALLAAEIDAWRAAGYPAISHSPAYRALYHPAYRLVPAAAERFLALFQAVDELVKGKGGARVAIDGNSGAGKSTLGALLAAAYGGNLYHMDDFFLPAERKTPARLAEPGGNVDWERFRGEVLSRLGTAFSYRPWRCREGRLAAPVAVWPRAVEIVEGVYSLHPALRDAYDLRVFLSIDAAAQEERIRLRSGEAMLRRFQTEWIPLENAYFNALNIRQSCQLVY
ncbi:MAG TPA: hypothetical protein IAA75_05450 [Candidatus Pullichristensenella avicola]|nr:hypothetical protein [Candidatus Pullichristensenella avicola]